MAGTRRIPICLLAVFLLSICVSPRPAHAGDRGRILVLVDAGVHSRIRWELGKYQSDLRMIGYSTTLLVQDWPDGFAVRETLQSGYTNNLVGALLVGTVPIPHFLRDSQPRPCVLALMDIDGRWQKDDTQSHYIETPHWPQIAPEIWVGVLSPNAGAASQSSQLRTYFKKLRAFRARLAMSRRAAVALSFVERPWTRYSPFGLDQLYPGHIAVVSNPSQTTASRLKAELTRGYQFVTIASHNNGGFAGVGVEGGKRGGRAGVTADDVRELAPTALFYHLFSCSVCCPTKQDYFGGSLLFSSGNGLLVHGTTMPGGMNQADFLYARWLETGSFGAAMKLWYKDEIPRDKRATNRRWYLGAICLGDPTIPFPRIPIPQNP